MKQSRPSNTEPGPWLGSSHTSQDPERQAAKRKRSREKPSKPSKLSQPRKPSKTSQNTTAKPSPVSIPLSLPVLAWFPARPGPRFVVLRAAEGLELPTCATWQCHKIVSGGTRIRRHSSRALAKKLGLSLSRSLPADHADHVCSRLRPSLLSKSRHVPDFDWLLA
ncbi:uncharacterized protein THITE_2120677 [Thermothielavioides terrestris NRRL 8126]|jgi:hypothetical protein|uniref:Uncharacterized protein n=1 Tax=Thermothielavioides terrestris (strain ATCC 38088 / NRRL 8126) TaxID=578455 RepID=G2RD80_THETT|nr:uncharacterized protein THITE_2120677 [Thermothielavioides terrestris NRRL 8126]AEO69915.1 hypothetical protein THITE_2120677 [Thermothielavioides terrestris NRRL 8126]